MIYVMGFSLRQVSNLLKGESGPPSHYLTLAPHMPSHMVLNETKPHVKTDSNL